MAIAAWVAVVLAVAPDPAPSAPVPSRAARPIPALAALPFTISSPNANAEVEASRAYLEQHVLSWVQRYGQPLDDGANVRERLGVDGLAALGRCAAEPATCSELKNIPYQAVMSGEIHVATSGTWTVTLQVVGTKNGSHWITEVASQATMQQVLDPLITSSRAIAEMIIGRIDHPKPWEPATRSYSTLPFVLGGISAVTGTVFLILSSSQMSALDNKTLSLNAALDAKSTGQTEAIVGYSLIAVGVASLALGLILYKPGALPPDPPVSVSVDPTRGMLVIGGRLP